jgi:hypothetical protein
MKRKNSSKEHCFFTLYEAFIRNSQSGKRLQPNGKRIMTSTLGNYRNTLRLLRAFSLAKQYPLRLRSFHTMNSREVERERNYWKKFYRRFTEFLYEDCGHYDNYVGHCIKNIKVFFNYLNKETSLFCGHFHKSFYVRKEEISIFPLMPEDSISLFIMKLSKLLCHSD